MENFGRLSAPSLKELFVDRVASMILSGELGVGERFPPERELAAQMGVSKTVVHGGFQELQRMGFVCIRPQSGVYVADYMADGNLETFNALFRYNGDSLSLETIRAVFDFRLAIEGFGMKRLAAAHSEADITLLRAGIDDIGALVAAGAESSVLAARFYAFHKTLLRLSGCFMLTLCFNAVEESAVHLEERYIRTIGVGSAINRLTAFVDAIERGDGDMACLILGRGLDEQYAQYRRERNGRI